MDWKTIAKDVAPFAGTLAKLLPIPGAGIAGDLISKALDCDPTPDSVAAAMKSDPDAGLKLAKIESDNKAMLEREYTARLEAVNATMQAESQSEHWMQWSWRPFVGFIFGLSFFGVYFVLPLAKIPVPSIPSEAWMMVGAILGVASWHRGAAKVKMAKSG